MVYLHKNKTNKFALFFNDVKTLANPFYLFQLKKEDSKEILNFNWVDVSSSKCNFNLFEVDEDLRGGQYEMKVYEATGSTTEISGTTGIPIWEDLLIVEIERTVNTNAPYNIYK